jgi:hypothetical protein
MAAIFIALGSKRQEHIPPNKSNQHIINNERKTLRAAFLLRGGHSAECSVLGGKVGCCCQGCGRLERDAPAGAGLQMKATSCHHKCGDVFATLTRIGYAAACWRGASALKADTQQISK